MVHCCSHPSLHLTRPVTWVDLLQSQAQHQPEQTAFTFLADGDAPATCLTYAELDQRSRAIAAQLQHLGLAGERALLLYPPGLEFLSAFLGCLYAGVVAVPAYPPHNQRNTPRILAVIADAQAAIALTTTDIQTRVQTLLAEKTDQRGLQWLTTDDIDGAIADQWRTPEIDSQTLAFLQYTSGSTGTPKGVMLSHSNLLHNAAITYELMAHSPESRFVSWLPTYHDMGLIGGILQPLYGGFPCYLMAPATFLQQPYRWLKAISDYGGTTSGGPNFAYDLCVRKITPEQRRSLDLSRWQVAFNGAEPVRAQTLERFAATFAECGFRAEAFYPCYGMAEATLMAAGGMATALPPQLQVATADLEQHQVKIADASEDSTRLVGCGQSVPQQQIVIAHPETLTLCPPETVGEIWVQGPSVGQGYWNRPEETTATFGAHLVDTGAGPFLRTGDLGFLREGELFITGRLKDLIIIRGRNLYPQDIELTVERSHPALRAGSGAAFAIALSDTEGLVVVQELEFRQRPEIKAVIQTIRAAIAQEYEIPVYAVVLIKPGTIPKTSSGKIQRRACRTAFFANQLTVVGQEIYDLAPVTVDVGGTSPALDRAALLAIAPVARLTPLVAALQAQIAQILHLNPDQIGADQALTRLGLDSLSAFEIKYRIEANFGVAIALPDLFAGATVAQLAQQILAQVSPTPLPQLNLQACPREGALPLGLAQERLWFLQQLEPENPFYHVAIAVQLTGTLDVTVLQQSLNEIVRRHEVLRTCFIEVEGQPVQQIQPVVELPLTVIDASNLTQDGVELALTDTPMQQLILQASRQPFDLSQPPLLRTSLIRLAASEHLLLLTMHHMISDGWSVGVWLRELTTLYAAYLRGQASPLAELPFQYADFALWQRQLLQQQSFQASLDYWQQQLKGPLPVLQLNPDRPRPAIQSFVGQKQAIAIPQQLTTAVKTLSQQTGTTLFMTLLAAFKVLLFSYAQTTDLVVGTPTAGRRPETAGLIGFLINTLVLRTDLSGNPSFLAVLERVRQGVVAAFAHQELPFEKLVASLQPERSLSYNPLFQVMFIFQNVDIAPLTLPELTFRPLEVDSGSSKFDLKLSLWESEVGLQGSFEYQTELLEADQVAEMRDRLQRLLQQVVTQPEISLAELVAVLKAQEQAQRRLQAEALAAAQRQQLRQIKRQAIPAHTPFAQS